MEEKNASLKTIVNEASKTKFGRSGMEKSVLEEKKVSELRPIAQDLKILGYQEMKKDELISAILRGQLQEEGLLLRKGVLDILSEGYGFLRTRGCLPSEGDIYVSLSQIRRFSLRRGDEVEGQVRPPKDTEKYNALLRIEAVNGTEPETARSRVQFESLTPIYPDVRLRLEARPTDITTRTIDLVAPIGKGQR